MSLEPSDRHLPEPVSAASSIFAHPGYVFAIRSILDAASRGPGFRVLTGEPGTGITTLLSDLKTHFERAGYLVGGPVRPEPQQRDMLSLVSVAFDLECTSLDDIAERLCSRCPSERPAILILDDAQNLAPEALPAFWPLENPALQVLLAGRDGVWDLLNRPDHGRVRQWVLARCRLCPLCLEETAAYVAQVVASAGGRDAVEISSDALRHIHARTGGLLKELGPVLSSLDLRRRTPGAAGLELEDIEDAIESVGRSRPGPLVISADMSGEEASTSPSDTATHATFGPPSPVQPQPHRSTPLTDGTPDDSPAIATPPSRNQPVAPRGRDRKWVLLGLAAAGVMVCVVVAIALMGNEEYLRKITGDLHPTPRETPAAGTSGAALTPATQLIPPMTASPEPMAAFPKGTTPGTEDTASEEPTPPELQPRAAGASPRIVGEAPGDVRAEEQASAASVSGAIQNAEVTDPGLAVGAADSAGGDARPEETARHSVGDSADAGSEGQPTGKATEISEIPDPVEVRSGIDREHPRPSTTLGPPDAMPERPPSALPREASPSGIHSPPSADANLGVGSLDADLSVTAETDAIPKIPNDATRGVGGATAPPDTVAGSGDTGARPKGPELFTEDAAGGTSPSVGHEAIPGDGRFVGAGVPAETLDTATGDRSAALARRSDVVLLVQKAEDALTKDHLMVPFHLSAYSLYQQVFDLDPSNEQAHAGVQRIVQRYRELARLSLERADRDAARRYASRGLDAAPGDPEFLAIQSMVSAPGVE